MAALIAPDFPSEISEKFAEFSQSLSEMERILDPIFTTSIPEMQEKFEPLDRAKFDLVSAYALNSLFFMYLRCKGEDAQQHEIKKELQRIRVHMKRVKDRVDRKSAMRLNVPGVKRFLRNFLWTPNDQNDDDDMSNDNSKRKAECDEISEPAESEANKSSSEKPKEKRKKKKQ